LIESDGKIIGLNDAMATRLGKPQEDLIGKSIKYSLSPEILKSRVNKVLEASKTCKPVHFRDFRDGRWLESSVYAIFDSKGKVSRYAIYSRDITEKLNAERNIIESEEKFHKVFMDSPNSVIITRVRDGAIVNVNETFVELSGFSKDEIIGKTTVELGFWDNIKDRKKVIDFLIKNKIIKNMEVKFKNRNGVLMETLLSAVLIEVSKEKHFVSIVQDITEKKMAERNIIKSEEKFHKVFMNSPWSIVISRLKDGVVVEVNETFERLSGYSKEEAIGKTSLELGFWNNPKDRKKIMETLRKNRFIKNIELKFKNKKGVLMDTLYSAVIIDISNEMHVVSIVQNITEKKKAEEKIKVKNLEIKKSQGFLQNVIESASDMIFSIDDNGRILSWNSAAEFISGYKPWEIINKNIRSLDIFEKYSLLEVFNNNIKDIKEDIILKPKFGNHRTISFSISKLALENNKRGLAFIGKDITPKTSADLLISNSYILKDKNNGHKIFLGLLDSKTKGVCITREFDKIIESALTKKELNVILLKNFDFHKELFFMSNLFDKISKFTNKQNTTIIFLDRIDYIISIVGFPEFLKLLYKINDFVKASSAILLVNTNSKVLKKHELALLEEELLPFPEFDVEKEPLDQYLMDILNYINKNRINMVSTTFSNITKEFRISTVTTRKRLSDLLEKGFVEVIKKGRNKVLNLSEKAIDFLET